MMQGYRNLPGRYDVIANKETRRALWYSTFHTCIPPRELDEARQVLVWFQLGRRGQALMPIIEPWIIGWAMDKVLAALDEGGAT